MLKVVESGAGREAEEQHFALDEIARVGARRMLMAALEAEAADYVERHRRERDESGRALVAHNGRGPKRARLPMEQERWSCGRRGSMIAGATMKGAASVSPAASWRPTCGVRPRWPRCCPSCTCVGFHR